MQIALVTGGSRGVGRGAAIGLAHSGFAVYATGRTIEQANLPEAIHRVRCDHGEIEESRRAIARVGPVDVLVNNAWGGYERMVEGGKFTWGLPFWEQPDHRWQSMVDVGVRGAFIASAAVAPGMIARGRGLIVNIGFWAAQKYVGNAVYGVAKAATDKMTSDMARELAPHGVAVVSLYPGLVRTESVMEAAKGGWLDVSQSESPEFIGRVIAALWADGKLMERTGKVAVAAAVARELGVVDIDGKRPVVLRLEDL